MSHEQVRRNRVRFPEDFALQTTIDERRTVTTGRLHGRDRASTWRCAMTGVEVVQSLVGFGASP